VTKLINRELQSYRAQLDEIIKDLHELTIHIGHEELSKTVSDLRNRIHEPFMFVIVGEVKAGKSSFINALLDTGEEVAKVAPQPLTDTIQQILYGEEEEVIIINKFLKKILRPIDILKEIAIVDTPGTNTIVEHHQEITEGFIPASDLIVFVFEAKNPYRQSSWDFFDFIHDDWRKKTIFVLQQKDLLPPEDLKINVAGVEEQAKKKGIADPMVFAVSAKQELEGHKEASGFREVRSYISENITGGQAPVLKLQNTVDTCQNINDQISGGLGLRRQQYEADQEFREDIRQTLDQQEQKAHKQVDVLVENLLAGYDRITREKEQELSSGLSFFALVRRSFASMFSKKASAQDWLENLLAELEEELNSELKNKLNDGIVDLADSIQQMAKIIDLKIRNSQTLLSNDHELFSDIGERRNNVLMDLQATFAQFIARSENFTDETMLPDSSSLAPNIVSGSGIAAIGIILATVTSGTVFDITGGILTALGLAFAGLSTRGKRRKILQGFRDEIAEGRTRIEAEVTEKLKNYISQLKNRISYNFRRFDEMLEKEEEQLQALESEQAEIEEKLSKMEGELADSV